MRILACVALALAVGWSAPQGTRDGSPEDNLPPGMTRLTHFGERASWSPDGKRIAFMEKSFGDAYEVDLATRQHPAADALRASRIPARAVPAERRLLPDRRAHLHRHQHHAVARPGDVDPEGGLQTRRPRGAARSQDLRRRGDLQDGDEDRVVEHARAVSRPSSSRTSRSSTPPTSSTKAASPGSRTRRRSFARRRRSARSRRRTSAATTPS